MQQVADWLERLGLSQYARCFAENDISFVILPDLTDQDLEKIGVASLGHRRLLLRSIAELKIVDKTTPSPDAAASAPPAAAKMDMAERRQVRDARKNSNCYCGGGRRRRLARVK
jgi:hypothetical protein